MTAYTSFFRSSVGKKMVVAVTGIILILFVIGHLLGNLQIFLGPDWVNSYAEHHDEAALSMQEAIVEYDRLLERGPNKLYSQQVAELRVRLGSTLVAAGRSEEGPSPCC